MENRINVQPFRDPLNTVLSFEQSKHFSLFLFKYFINHSTKNTFKKIYIRIPEEIFFSALPNKLTICVFLSNPAIFCCQHCYLTGQCHMIILLLFQRNSSRVSFLVIEVTALAVSKPFIALELLCCKRGIDREKYLITV